MYALIITFYISLLGIIAMLLFKRQELKSGKRSVVSRFGQETDHVFHSVFSSARKAFSYVNKRTFIVIAQWLAFHVLFHVRKVYVEAKDRALANPHSKKVIDAVRGRGEIQNHGASFYLRRIGDK